jgi:outer membrane lipoprotein-sorting protein
MTSRVAIAVCALLAVSPALAQVPKPADAPPAAVPPAAAPPAGAPAAGAPPAGAPLTLGPPPGTLTAPPLAVPAAAPAAPLKLTPPQKDALTGINTYFNGVRTLAGNFEQFGPDGQRTEGQFFIMKPGRIRFQYAKPSNLEVVSDSVDVIVKNRKTQEQDLYPLSKTPLKYLLADKLDLTSEANVTKVSVEPDLVTVVVEQSTIFGDGKLSLVFDRKTNELRQWTVTDAQGFDTVVVVRNAVANQPVDEKIFRIDKLPIIPPKDN